jgi:hypothetical protein
VSTRLVPLLSAALAVSLVAALACRSTPVPPAPPGVPDRVDFNFHVRPILSDRCFACHGPDDRARKAGLRLDIREHALAKLESGRRAIVPGRPGSSELVRRIYSSDPKLQMPEPSSHLTLSDVERGVLARWIEQGAEWQPHWAFIPPAKPEVPKPSRGLWARNEIDRFVLARLETRGMTPSSDAERETLLRRVSMDLTGLPPTMAELDAFVADTSADAYERAVDRLLASTAYGERMAVDWLDLARYADSHGYQDDGMRDMWPWRDWVISAFNRNLPFDQFVTWQLAGDLLPDATDEQRLATGFNRHHMQSQEGGVVPEEYRTEYVADRVNTFGRAFLGVSVECARCHDHKYDPITQKEFFELFAFFNSVNESGQIPYSGIPSPSVMVMDAETRTAVDALRKEIAALEAGIQPRGDEFERRFASWLNSLGTKGSDPLARDGLIGHLPLDADVRKMERPKADPNSKTRPEPREIVSYENRVNRKQRVQAARRQLHQHRREVRVLRTKRAVLVEPLGAARRPRCARAAGDAVGRRHERQPRLRNHAACRRPPHRRPASRLSGQLHRDRDAQAPARRRMAAPRPDV